MGKGIDRVDYSTSATPGWYQCKGCGARGVKLWRGYQEFYPTLLCVDCSGKEQKVDVSGMDERGMRETDLPGNPKSDTIKWRVPAVPTEDGTPRAYWGYTSVPERGVKWWRSLPLHTRLCAVCRDILLGQGTCPTCLHVAEKLSVELHGDTLYEHVVLAYDFVQEMRYPVRSVEVSNQDIKWLAEQYGRRHSERR